MVIETGAARGGDKLPPHDVEAEEAVIASILVDPAAVLEVLGSNLKPDDFFREQNRWIYETCLALFDQGVTITQICDSHVLARTGTISHTGGPATHNRLVPLLLTSSG